MKSIIIKPICIIIMLLLFPLHASAEGVDDNFIDTVEITITAPIAGENPDDSVAFPGSADYIASFEGGWFEGTVDTFVSDGYIVPQKFEYGVSYVACIRVISRNTDKVISPEETVASINGVEATCINSGVDSSGKTYVDFAAAFVAACINHQPETVNAREATFTEEGYTGDTCCKVCGALISEGTAIPVLSDEIASGACGANGTWRLNGNENDIVLTISGTGAMPQYTYLVKTGASSWRQVDDPPWKNYREHIKKIVVEEGITSLPGDAFHGCGNTSEVSLPSTLVSIGDNVFSGFDIDTIILPEGLSSIGNYCFQFSSIKSINIPASLVSIGIDEFGYCPEIESITVSPDNPKYDSRDNCNALIETETNKMIEGCNTTIIPETVTSLDYYTFHGRYGLKSISIPASVNWLVYDSFSDCTNLETITVDEDNQIYDSRENCNAIIETETDSLLLGTKKTTIPNSVKIIKYCSLEDTGWSRIDLPENIEEIQQFAFPNTLKDLYLTGGLTTINENAFYNLTVTVHYPCNVDVTNIIGQYNGTLTWKPYHSDLNKIQGNAATCTEDGAIDYWKCGDCEKKYSDGDCNCEVTQGEIVITAKGHDWDIGTTTIEPTCTGTGLIIYNCNREGCDASKSKTEPALGHNLEHREGKEATCTNFGFDAYEACTRCDYTEGYNEIPAKGHDNPLQHTAGKTETCTEDGNKEYWYCSKCDKYFSDEDANNPIAKNSWIINAPGHAWDEGVVTKKATCTATGTRTFTCATCSETKTETIAALGHTWKHYKKAAGLLKNGTEYDYCTVCKTKKNVKIFVGYATYYVKSFKVAKAKKAFTAKWAKQSASNQKKFNGYQIRYSTKSNMSGAKYVTAGKSSKSKKVSKLKKKTKYYIQVRTYTKSSGKTFYSKWSAKKSVKTK